MADEIRKAVPGTTYLYDTAKSLEENQRIANLQGFGVDYTGPAKVVRQGPVMDTVTNYRGMFDYSTPNTTTRVAPSTIMSATQTAGYSGRIPPEMRGATADQTIGGQKVSEASETAQQRYLTQILGDIDTRRSQASQTYSQMYEDLLRSQRMQRGLSDVSGYRGGMQEQLGEKRSAVESAALAQVGMGREAAIRDIETERFAAESNANLMAQQEFEIFAGRQNQLTGTANNYFALAQEALQAGDTERAETLQAEGDRYLGLANQMAGEMQAVSGTPMPQQAPGGAAPTETPTEQTITVPTINFETEVTGSIGVTEKAKTAFSSIAADLSNVATSGTDNYAGYNSTEIYFQSEIFNKLPGKITTDPKRQEIRFTPFDRDLIQAIRAYEEQTNNQVIESDQQYRFITKANAKKVLAYYYNIHGAISANN